MVVVPSSPTKSRRSKRPSIHQIILLAAICSYFSLCLYASRLFSLTEVLPQLNTFAFREETYKHDISNIASVRKCNKHQRDAIYRQLVHRSGGAHIHKSTRCPVATWIETFFKEEADIGTETFLGISVGCNKGHDAIRTARMGMSTRDFDGRAWKRALELSDSTQSGCSQENAKQMKIRFPKRAGEMHCIEPMPTTFASLKKASNKLDLESKHFFVKHAAISSANGAVKFPREVDAGTENMGIKNCQTNQTNCVDVAMYTLDNYVDRFVASKGPVNILQIDVEGWDFDVLFGSSSTLDRTYYLEFEYHKTGNWFQFHLQDAVKLLDGKGFTCYWAGNEKLWRITKCYFELYDQWHGWSNVACVHRSHEKLARRIEGVFLSVAPAVPDELWHSTLHNWCGTCLFKGGIVCDQRLAWVMEKNPDRQSDSGSMLEIMERGECTKDSGQHWPYTAKDRDDFANKRDSPQSLPIKGLVKPLSPSLHNWCGTCLFKGGPRCDERIPWIMKKYERESEEVVMLDIMKEGHCMKNSGHRGAFTAKDVVADKGAPGRAAGQRQSRPRVNMDAKEMRIREELALQPSNIRHRPRPFSKEALNSAKKLLRKPEGKMDAKEMQIREEIREELALQQSNMNIRHRPANRSSQFGRKPD